MERLRLKDYHDSATFFSDFEKTVNELKSAGATVTEKEKLNYMLNTLPESYSYIGDLIDTLKVEDQTADYVKSKIEMAEMKITKDENPGRKSNVFMVNKSQQNWTCYGCGEAGHIQRNCRNNKQASDDQRWRSSRGRQGTGRGVYRGRGSFRGYRRNNQQQQATPQQRQQQQNEEKNTARVTTVTNLFAYE